MGLEKGLMNSGNGLMDPGLVDSRNDLMDSSVSWTQGKVS